jgi:RNA polymerase sigma-70 factor, ECF subfamily
MQISLDPDMIRRIRKGDRIAIGRLFERYQPSIFRYLYYKVGDMHTAEDLTSEVFVHFMLSLSKQSDAQDHPDSMPLQALLFKIARNLAIDHFRKHQSQQNITLEENISTSDPPIDATVERNLDNQLLNKAINTLPFDQREVIILRFINSMPIADTAQVMLRSQDAVKALQRRALAALHEVLAEMRVTT